MIDKIKNHKKVAALGVIALLMAGGAAYAYWTNGGTGSGTAATDSSLPITVNQTSTITGLAPGATAQVLSGDFDNPNASAVLVAHVDATITSVTGGTGGCAVGDYTLAGFPAVVGLPTVAPGSASGTWTGGTIQMVETGANQDNCQGATVHIDYTSD
jgi:hypothetical protein